MNIPFIDLKAQYESIKSDIDIALSSSFSEFRFCRGKQVTAFEDSFAQIIGVKNCIAVGNGTDALFIALKAIGIKPGDEVITPAFSWISTAETISLCGGTPVFADVDPLYYTLDPKFFEDKITQKTKAVLAVHLYGQAAALREIKKICIKHNLKLIEDCAQGHLTSENDQYAGSYGDLACFSFYPTKNLGAYGDAGCILTNNEAVAQYARRFSNHGALEKDDHLIEGTNSRMDTVQAAVLLAKLPHLKKWNEKRIAHASSYSELLKGITDLRLPMVRPGTSHTFHLYVIRTSRRDELKKYLSENGIQTLVHYPSTLPNLPAYKHMNLPVGNFPVSSKLQEEVLSLPIYPELQETQIIYICQKIREFFKG
jgi:dTDP-4-amino-4,6-dideoxygalactose transaminase